MQQKHYGRIVCCRIGTLSLLFTGISFFAAGVSVYFWNRSHVYTPPTVTGFSTVNISFAQIELQAAVDGGTPPENQPEPEVIIETLPEQEPEKPVPEQDVDVILEQPEPPAEEPECEPEFIPPAVQGNANITQEAAAPQIANVEPDVLLFWVQTLIEQKKYYPPAAEKIGLTGRFRLLVKISADGTITSAEITGGKGHTLLRNALTTMLNGITGQTFGQPLPSPLELPFEFEFETTK